MIKQYIYRVRNGNRRKVGLLVAVKDGGYIGLGYSLCSKLDKFDSDKAHVIAVGRATVSNNRFINYPPSIINDVRCFALRAQRAFKESALFPADEFILFGGADSE